MNIAYLCPNQAVKSRIGVEVESPESKRSLLNKIDECGYRKKCDWVVKGLELPWVGKHQGGSWAGNKSICG